MGEAPNNFVLKAYLTEDNARTDTTPLQVKTDTSYISNGEQLVNFNFFTHTKYFFRIESNEPVDEFYIDWDDGEDNNPKGKANYTSIKLDSPQFVGITSHIFTRDKIQYPKIRVKSVSGFWSKFYQASGDHTFVGIDVLQAEASNQLVAGRNDRYKIEADTATPANSRIPAFAPTPKPPICILKSDKKRVFSGINNALLGGKKGVKEGSTVRLTGGSNKIEEIRTTTEVKVTYTTTGLDTNNDTDWGDRGDITTDIMTFSGSGNARATLQNVLEILKVELVNQLEDSVSAGGTSPATNKLYPGERMFLTLGSGKPSAVADSWANGYPSNIAEVSLGSPILEVNDPRCTVTLDATESYARTPEQTIDEYYIDDGKKHLNRGYTEGHYYQELGTVNKFTDIFKKSTLSGSIDTNKTNSGLMKRSYSFDIHHDWCDDNFRWLPKQVLARGQVKTSTPAVAASPASDSKATYTYSFLEHWQNDSHATNYNTDGAAATYSWPDDMKSSNLLCMVGDRSGARDDWKDLSLRNRAASSKSFDTANSVIFGIHGSTVQGSASSFDSESPSDFLFGDAATLDANNNIGIVLAARDKKWTKQYFQRALDHSVGDDLTLPMAPRVNPAGTPHGEATSSATNFGGVGYDGYSYMNMRIQAFYTGLQGDGASSAVGGAGAMWKPLKILNKTKHPDYDDTTWYTSGVFEWEEPEDWVSVDPADIPDRYWPSGDFEGDAAAFARDTDVVSTPAVAQIETITVAGANISSNNEVSAQGEAFPSTANVSDGLSVLRNSAHNQVIGRYFTFSKQAGTDTNYACWFRQNATVETVSFRLGNSGNTSLHWTNLVDQVGGYGTALYGRWFKLTEADGTTHGFWLNFGTNNESGYNGPTLSPWTSGIYDGSPGASIGAAPDNIHAVDLTGSGSSAIDGTVGGSSSTTVTGAIADKIVSTINGVSGLGYSTKVVDGSSRVFILVKFTGTANNASATGGAGHIATPFYADHVMNDNNQKYFAPFGYSAGGYANTLTNRDIQGKAQGVSPSPTYQDLSAVTEIPVPYDDGASDTTIASAIRTAIEGHADWAADDIGGSGTAVTITQPAVGAVADAADGVADSVASDDLDLRTRFTFAVNTNGVDQILGGNFFNGKWDNTYSKYAIMFVVEADGDPSDAVSDSEYGHMAMLHTWPCSNNHSVLIDIVDPMCVSLSPYSIAQSISFSHKGKHQIVTDRLGKADIRKIGADGGMITFGGVDLKDTGRKAFYDFQRQSTPVYMDVSHTNGEFSRFFGTIISMSENHPQGGMFPKFGLQMQVSHMIQFDANGNVISNGYISLGGDMDEPSFI